MPSGSADNLRNQTTAKHASLRAIHHPEEQEPGRKEATWRAWHRELSPCLWAFKTHTAVQAIHGETESGHTEGLQATSQATVGLSWG